MAPAANASWGQADWRLAAPGWVSRRKAPSSARITVLRSRYRSERTGALDVSRRLRAGVDKRRQVYRCHARAALGELAPGQPFQERRRHPHQERGGQLDALEDHTEGHTGAVRHLPARV